MGVVADSVEVKGVWGASDHEREGCQGKGRLCAEGGWVGVPDHVRDVAIVTLACLGAGAEGVL